MDLFIQQRQAEAGLTGNPPASRTEWIRRAHYDLWGLPPSVEDLEHWETHTAPNWRERLVDSLLASPRYGERWGRLWLDVAGYADSEGGTTEDPIRTVAWKYRDYVVSALNRDKPWDRFLQEQIAGDELADFTKPGGVTEEVVDNLLGTGFLRMTVDQTGSRTMNFAPERIGVVSDVLNIVSSGVMGVTMECARCHAHKYDPIPQTDYYRLKAVFQGVFDEHDWMSWKTRELVVATPEVSEEWKAAEAAVRKRQAYLKKQRSALLEMHQQAIYDEQWPQLTSEQQQTIEAALAERPAKRTPEQKELVERYEREIRPAEAVLVAADKKLAAQLKKFDQQVKDLEKDLPPSLAIRAAWDRGRPSPTYVLVRGEYNRPGRPVGPAPPSVLMSADDVYEAAPPWPGASSTGRRLAFARWLTEADHPTTSRVFVNRVWKHHFGRGLVKTLDNFGAQGVPPTHPDLLDWLSRDFASSGWSLKRLHRRMMLTQTYAQSSRVTSPATDPENLWLARMPLQRLDAEALRDAMLSVSKSLEAVLGGPPVPVQSRPDGMVMEAESTSGVYRRSLYLTLRRTEMPTMLSTFDYPQMQPNCSERTASTVSTQSLVLWNNARVRQLAERWAAELLREANGEEAARIEHAYRAAYSRRPDEGEVRVAVAALEQLRSEWRAAESSSENIELAAWTTFCHALLNSAEFVYID